MMMKEKKEFKINLSVSCCNYDEKPTGEDYAKMMFEKRKLSLDGLLNKIKKGYSIMAELKSYSIIEENKKGHIKRYQKHTEKDVLGNSLIGFDIDDCQIGMSDYINMLSLKPTIAYTTPNNGNKGYRFRLFYVVNTPITKQEDFRKYYEGLAKVLEKETTQKINDNCGNKIERLFNGNSKGNIETYKSDIIYSIDELPKGMREIKTTKKNLKHEITKPKYNNIFNDYFNLENKDFIRKYKPVNEIIQHTKIKYNDKGYCLLNDDYIEIRRFDKDGLIKKGIGEGRKKYLYNIIQLKKKIKPSVTIEELLFNAVFEITYYIDNGDNKLNKKYVLDLVTSVFHAETTIKPYEEKRKFKVSKKYCEEHNTTPNIYKNQVKKELNYNKIDKWYNKGLSPLQNYKISKPSDCKISIKTIYNYAKEKGYIKNEKLDINEWYDDTISINDNLIIAKDSDIKISKSKLYKWCKDNNINTKGKEIITTINDRTFYFNENISIDVKQYINENNKECCKECLLKIFSFAQ